MTTIISYQQIAHHTLLLSIVVGLQLSFVTAGNKIWLTTIVKSLKFAGEKNAIGKVDKYYLYQHVSFRIIHRSTLLYIITSDKCLH